jgi:predicted TIM-barrel fold metal-dependent hydrolase
MNRKINPASLEGKLIDIHSHAGVHLKAYICAEYPYACSIETIACHQKMAGVDVNVVFPFSADLFFDSLYLKKGICRPSVRSVSPSPYAIENQLLLREVYEFCPEYSGRFLPFISIDPGRSVAKQIKNILMLEKKYPIYGIKISPVICQSRITALLGEGRDFLDLVREKNWPLLLHTTVHKEEKYSNAAMAFEVIEKNQDIRFCLAHCIGFHDRYLRLADMMKNVWVDTAALKIQVQMARENSPIVAGKRERFKADYRDHRATMKALAEEFPDTIIWGTDAPAYSYICRRKQADGVYMDFVLKARYEDEIAALNSLPDRLKVNLSNHNSIKFIFGSEAKR